MRRYIAMAVVVVLAACGGGGDTGPVTPTPVAVASVAISGGVSALVLQQTTQFSAVAQSTSGSALAGRTITWSATLTAVASVDASRLVPERWSSMPAWTVPAPTAPRGETRGSGEPTNA